MNYNNVGAAQSVSGMYAELFRARGPNPRGRIVGVANQKGGVGKTTTSVNLAAALALRGHRILLVDVDPQSNATTGVGIDHRRLDRSTYDVLMGESPLLDVVQRCSVPGLECAPASLDLAGAELQLAEVPGREQRLARALQDVANRYDVVIVDCPPSLGLLTINALAAGHDLIVPVQCEYYALEGLGQMLETADRVRKAFNPELRIGGLLLTMYDARTKLAGQVADEIKAHFPGAALKTVIPRSVRLSEAPSFGEPVVTLDPAARGSIAYRLLAAEIEGRFGLHSRGGGNGRQPGAATAVPGPGGRGYGTVTSVPRGVEEAWPPPVPWAAESTAREER